MCTVAEGLERSKGGHAEITGVHMGGNTTIFFYKIKAGLDETRIFLPPSHPQRRENVGPPNQSPPCLPSFHGLIRDDQKVAGEILHLLKRIRIIPPLTNPGSGGLDRSI